jgi:pyridoxal phosphate enzyme (YggS family)
MPQEPFGMSDLKANAEAVLARIEAACRRANRDSAEIRLIWVGKNHPREKLLEAHALGGRLFGENRVQEALEKFPLTAPDGSPLDHELHLIGHLQKNKVRKILPLCKAVHSVDSPELWQALDRVSGELGLCPDVFLQVNTSREPRKGGFAVENFVGAAAALPPAPNLRLVGLMTLGPLEGGPESARPCFRELRDLLDRLRNHPELESRFPDARFLSMGMSGDFEVAVEEGAHFLRIGTALLGAR